MTPHSIDVDEKSIFAEDSSMRSKGSILLRQVNILWMYVCTSNSSSCSEGTWPDHLVIDNRRQHWRWHRLVRKETDDYRDWRWQFIDKYRRWQIIEDEDYTEKLKDETSGYQKVRIREKNTVFFVGQYEAKGEPNFVPLLWLALVIGEG